MNAVNRPEIASMSDWDTVPTRSTSLEVWPESHWPGFALRQTDVL